MKYSDFLEIYAKQNSCSNIDAKQATEKFLASLSEALASMETGESLVFVGTGSFSKMLQKGRKGVIPGTDKPYESQSKNVVRFKAGKRLIESINS